MIMTTTPGIDGKTVKEYLGVVTGEAVMGANLFKDLFAGIRDIVGGRSGAYEKELRKAREIALQETEAAAAQLGANAVVGIDIDYEVLGEKSGMLMVSLLVHLHTFFITIPSTAYNRNDLLITSSKLFYCAQYIFQSVRCM